MQHAILSPCGVVLRRVVFRSSLFDIGVAAMVVTAEDGLRSAAAAAVADSFFVYSSRIFNYV